MLAGVIFDLDGVLVDSHPVHRESWRELLLGAGKRVSETELDVVLEGGKREEILRHFLGDIGPAELARYCRQKDELFRNREGRLRTTRGARRFVRALDRAAIPKAIATSATRSRAMRILHRLGFADSFVAVLTGDDVARGKADPAIFLATARKLHCAPADLLVLEDSVPGIQAAKEAGMRCVALATGSRVPVVSRAGADRVVRDFTELRLEEMQRLFENGYGWRSKSGDSRPSEFVP